MTGRATAVVVLAALAYPPRAASAQSLEKQVDQQVAALAPAITAIRHDIHQHPELGNREVRTAALVERHLRALGFEVRTGIAHTGVVGILRGGRPGPFIAVRADMDALPVTEDTDLPFKSTVRGTYLGQDVGVMHACGHDIHVAVQLGVASVLASMKDRIPGTVQFIFQPAEEGPPPGEEGGAALMLKEGLWRERKPEAVFGLHASAPTPVGVVNWSLGPALASADFFQARILGRQAHGASPELSIDPIVTASQAVLGLQTIRSRNLSPFAPSVVTVGMIRGGTRENIIPAEVELRGTVRTYSAAVQDTIERRMREILDGTTRAAGASYELAYNRLYPVTVNDTALARGSLAALERALGKGKLRNTPPIAGAEDFSFFANETPGFFFFLGTLAAGTVSGDHHTPTFRADDAAIPVGMKAMSYVLLDYLERHARPKGAGVAGAR